MSELMNDRRGGVNFRWQLLASVSAAVLVASAGASDAAYADNDADRPTVWIELGGQLEGMDSPQQAFSPPFLPSFSQHGIQSPLGIESAASHSIGTEGAVSFEPHGSDWYSLLLSGMAARKAQGASISRRPTQLSKDMCRP